MCYVSEELREECDMRGAVYFYVKRIARIIPLYAVFSVLTLLIALMNLHYPFSYDFLMGRHYGVEKTSYRYLLETLTFTHFGKAPLFAIGWTLIYEFWFYTLFAICIATKSKLSVFFLIYAAVIVCVDLFSVTRKGWMTIVLSPLMLEFCFGILLYHVHDKAKILLAKNWFIPSTIILIIFFTIAYYDPNLTLPQWAEYKRAFTCGVAAFFIVFLFLSFENIFVPNKLFVFLGDASYSIYLTHWFCITLIPYFFWSIGWFPKGSLVIYIFASVSIAMILSILVYLYLERPMNRFFSKQINQFTRFSAVHTKKP
jgi:exopolysaccharide production protein ExoZ